MGPASRRSLLRSATRVTVTVIAVILATAALSASAATLELHVRDRDGRGVSDVVVVAAAAEPATIHAGAFDETAVMDQQNRRFVPQVAGGADRHACLVSRTTIP